MNSGRDYETVKARFFSSIQTDSSNNCYKMGLKINNNENRTTASPCAEKYARKRGMICVSVLNKTMFNHQKIWLLCSEFLCYFFFASCLSIYLSNKLTN